MWPARRGLRVVISIKHVRELLFLVRTCCRSISPGYESKVLDVNLCIEEEEHNLAKRKQGMKNRGNEVKKFVLALRIVDFSNSNDFQALFDHHREAKYGNDRCKYSTSKFSVLSIMIYQEFAKRTLSVREVWSLIPGPVKSAQCR